MSNSEDFNENSSILSDLRIGSILKTETNITVFDTYGSHDCNSSQMYLTYSIFYSANITQAYEEITRFLIDMNNGTISSVEFFLFISKSFVEEGIHTMDYSFGPISIESYEMYLNTSLFEIVFKNSGCFIAKYNVEVGD
ncbi:hypothetical protein [Candidatus Lokiarchaeum ossiferum]|uniref:hypothetical protein n=1 Tax=Candidatus Lokiarchaeum ossiferum TaxID=2951803 RepID=UPI00352DC10E